MLYDHRRDAVARRLASAMAVAGLKNADLAQRCGVSDPAVGSWLKTGRIDPGRLPAISKAVCRSEEWLATGLEPESLAIAEKYQLLPQDSQATLEKVADSLTKSAQLSPTIHLTTPDRSEQYDLLVP